VITDDQASPDRIQLGNTVFEGQNNIYILDDDPATIIDTGIATPAIEQTLFDALAARGVAAADVDQIVLTHFHADHAGLAGEIQAESGATVFVHEADAPLVARAGSAWEEFESYRRDLFEQWEMPERPEDELTSYFERFPDRTGPAPSVTELTDGDEITVGDSDLQTVYLPGHTDGLCGFLLERAGREILFSGDALLPTYTPNVGGADVRVSDPLETYVDTLVRIVEMDPDIVLPGHREPIEDPAGRAREILHHHYDRTRRVVETLRTDGPADAWTVSEHLFGSLEEIHILHGPGEAYAHLTHLESYDVVSRTGTAYALVEEDPDLPALFPDVAVP
jgi:glyoxylase-like metal-dependent hydrolase (beta-lactamase superfamily II)